MYTSYSPFIGPSIWRPKKDPQEIIERLKIALVYWYPLQRACKLVWLNRKTVYNAMKSNSWLSEEIEKYRNISPEEMMDFRLKIDLI